MFVGVVVPCDAQPFLPGHRLDLRQGHLHHGAEAVDLVEERHRVHEGEPLGGRAGLGPGRRRRVRSLCQEKGFFDYININ